MATQSKTARRGKVDEFMEEMEAQPEDRFSDFEFLDKAEAPARTPKATVDPMTAKRNRFLETLETQKQLWRNPNLKLKRTRYVEQPGEERRKGVEEEYTPRSWFSRSGDKVIIDVRFGVRPMPLRDGKNIVKVPEDKVITFLDTLADAVREGEFDETIMELGTRKKRS